ncbi:MAG: hypothetical protein ACJ8FS_05775 [Sphingomicrobium sp.]
MESSSAAANAKAVMLVDPQLSLWIVSALCLVALLATFWRMKGGFGPQNLRAVGIVFVASLVAILSLVRSTDLTTAMGILGAIAGYLFGSQRSPDEERRETSGVSAEGATFGSGSRIAGRDINETLNRIVGDIDQIKDSVVHMTTAADARASKEYLFESSYEDDGEPLGQLAQSMKELASEGWALQAVFPSYDPRGLITLYYRMGDEKAGEMAVYHGREMAQLA